MVRRRAAVALLFALGAVVATNAVNTFDNADGAAGMLVALAALASDPIAAAALVPFLVLNLWRRGDGEVAAYLGDSGSHLLGLWVLITPAAWPVLVLPLARPGAARRRAPDERLAAVARRPPPPRPPAAAPRHPALVGAGGARGPGACPRCSSASAEPPGRSRASRSRWPSAIARRRAARLAPSPARADNPSPFFGAGGLRRDLPRSRGPRLSSPGHRRALDRPDLRPAQQLARPGGGRRRRARARGAALRVPGGRHRLRRGPLRVPRRGDQALRRSRPPTAGSSRACACSATTRPGCSRAGATSTRTRAPRSTGRARRSTAPRAIARAPTPTGTSSAGSSRWRSKAPRPTRTARRAIRCASTCMPRDARDPEKLAALFAALDEAAPEARVCFVGHSHVPGVFFEDGRYHRPKDTEGPYALGEGGDARARQRRLGGPAPRRRSAALVRPVGRRRALVRAPGVRRRRRAGADPRGERAADLPGRPPGDGALTARGRTTLNRLPLALFLSALVLIGWTFVMGPRGPKDSAAEAGAAVPAETEPLRGRGGARAGGARGRARARRAEPAQRPRWPRRRSPRAASRRRSCSRSAIRASRDATGRCSPTAARRSSSCAWATSTTASGSPRRSSWTASTGSSCSVRPSSTAPARPRSSGARAARASGSSAGPWRRRCGRWRAVEGGVEFTLPQPSGVVVQEARALRAGELRHRRRARAREPLLRADRQGQTSTSRRPRSCCRRATSASTSSPRRSPPAARRAPPAAATRRRPRSRRSRARASRGAGVFDVPAEALSFAGVHNKYFAVLLRGGGRPRHAHAEGRRVAQRLRRGAGPRRTRPRPTRPGATWPADVLLELDVPPIGGTETVRYAVYAGPKERELMSRLQPRLRGPAARRRELVAARGTPAWRSS